MNKFQFSLADIWQPAVLAAIGWCIVAALLMFRLGNLTPGFTDSELNQRSSAASVQKIVDNPLYLEQKTGQFILLKAGHKGPAAMRLPSILMGFIAVSCMFIILRNWHTMRMAILGTLLFATSSWFLHTARIATSDINYVMPLLLIIGGIWLHQKKFLALAVPLTIFSAVALLYIPAMVWLVLPAVLWQRRTLLKATRLLSTSWQTVFIMLAILGLIPLIWSLVQSPELIISWLGMPLEWPSSVIEYLKNITDVILSIFVHREQNPAQGIGRLPLLDVFTGAMVVLGIFAYLFRLKLDRTKLIIGIGILGVLFVGLNGPVSVSFLMPVVYILAAAGMTLLLQQWFTVFPRNPFARTLAFGVLTLAVLTSSYYHLNHYFIAWPNVPETKSTFSHRP